MRAGQPGGRTQVGGSLGHPPACEAGTEDGGAGAIPGAVEGAVIGLSLAGDVHPLLAWGAEGRQLWGCTGPAVVPLPHMAQARLPLWLGSPRPCTALPGASPWAGQEHLQMHEHHPVPSLPNSPHPLPGPSPPSTWSLSPGPPPGPCQPSCTQPHIRVPLTTT